MKPGALRYVVDSCLYVLLCALAIVGLLLAFVIPRGADQPKYFLGVHRHDWVDIHLWLALGFLVALLLHLLLNWRWIVATSKRIFGMKWRHRLWLLSLAWLLVLFAAWLLAYC